MTDKIEFTPDYGQKENSNIIKVLGVGGGGSNAVTHMYSDGIVGVDFLICNTDQGHLNRCPIPEKLLLGAGLGAGANPEVATQYANECKEKIKEFIGKETKMIFITAGMGKGTGTGASPVIAEIAHEMGILTIGVVTAPFEFEGDDRLRIANEGIEKMAKHIDSLIIVKNENILELYPDLEIDQAYEQANDVLKNAVKCIAELITVDYTQNVDFNDIQTIMKNSGKAMLGLASASGEDRVQKVIDDALSCPLLDNSEISEAQSFLFFVSYGPNNKLKIAELKKLTQHFKGLQAKNARVIWGQGVDNNLDDQIKLSVIVTRFNDKKPEDVATTTNNTNTIITDDQSSQETFVTTLSCGKELNEDTNPIQVTKNINGSVVVDLPVDNTPVQTQVINTPVVENTAIPYVGTAEVQAQPINNTIIETPQQIVTPVNNIPQTYTTSNVATFDPRPEPVKVSTNMDLLNDDNFESVVNTPTILRTQKLAEATAAQTQVETVVETSVNRSFYEAPNDRSNFFSCIAD